MCVCNKVASKLWKAKRESLIQGRDGQIMCIYICVLISPVCPHDRHVIIPYRPSSGIDDTCGEREKRLNYLQEPYCIAGDHLTQTPPRYTTHKHTI